MSESQGDSQPAGSGSSQSNDQSRTGDQPKTGDQSRTSDQPKAGQSGTGDQARTGGQARTDGQSRTGGQARTDGQSRTGGQARTDGQSRSGGRSRTSGQSGSRSQPGGGRTRGSDPIADFQRWLMKAGARSMANQVADQVKRTIGAERRSSGDVWDTATNEPPPTEPPECQWCPICQAARAARNGGAAGIGAQLANAGGVLASVVQDAFSAFEQVMKTQDQNRSTERSGLPAPPKPASDNGEDRGEGGQ